MLTPEFLLWSLEYRCLVRGLEDGTDPERTERQLRTARAVSDACREGRVLEGVAVDPPHGFRIDEALAIYGGKTAAESACRECPANVNSSDRNGLAGCYGFLALPAEARAFHAAVEHLVPQSLATTSPRWYGLWINSPLAADQLPLLGQMLAAVKSDDERCQRGIDELIWACNAAGRSNLRLYVLLYPPGRVEGTWWKLAPHCPRCNAVWRNCGTRCSVCGYAGHAAPEKKRRARGIRPYFPLDRLLGPERAAELVVRYESFRATRESPVPPQTPPPPVPPDSPPAG